MTNEQAKAEIMQIYGVLSPSKQQALDVAIKALEQETKWIPVSKRLPEDSGEYLITIKDRTYREISWFYSSDKKWSYRNAEIIAWMPLPKPYKPQESEDKG